MARRDKRFVGQSILVPYIPGEHAEVRHRRRLNINLGYYDRVKEYLVGNGYNIKLVDDCWVIWNNKNYFEWWPSKAKLIRNRKYRHGFHVHDVLQLLEIVFGEVVVL